MLQVPSMAPQLKANDVLKDLLESPDLQAAAARNLESLTEEFFLISSTFMEMVRPWKWCPNMLYPHLLRPEILFCTKRRSQIQHLCCIPVYCIAPALPVETGALAGHAYDDAKHWSLCTMQ